VDLNPALRPDLVPIHQLVLYDFWGARIASDKSTFSWRPLVTLSFRLQKKNQFWMRFFNIFLHALNAFLFREFSKKEMF